MDVCDWASPPPRRGLHGDPDLALRGLLLQRDHLLGALLLLLLLLQRPALGQLQQPLEQPQLLRERAQRQPEDHASCRVL